MGGCHRGQTNTATQYYQEQCFHFVMSPFTEKICFHFPFLLFVFLLVLSFAGSALSLRAAEQACTCQQVEVKAVQRPLDKFRQRPEF